MQVLRIDDGLWRWTVTHPDWKPGAEWDPEVGCVYWEGPDAVVLVDPQVPPPGPDRDRFFEALDRDVERVGSPVVVLTTCRWHARSAEELSARYAGRAISPANIATAALPARGAGDRRPRRRRGRLLARGCRARSSRETALLGDDAGGVRMCPQSWLDSGGSVASLRAELAPALSLAVERVLVSHGEPVLSGGRRRPRPGLGLSRRSGTSTPSRTPPARRAQPAVADLLP